MGGTQNDEALLSVDCGPFDADALDALAPDAKKLETRLKPPRGNRPFPTMGKTTYRPVLPPQW